MFSRLLAALFPARTSLGQRGERAAARYLRRSGYRILERQYRDRHGEIDLIATDGRAVVFVEVKTRRSDRRGHPAEAVDARKVRRMTRAAGSYLKRHHLEQTPQRFDIVAVIWPPGAWRPRLEHFPGAFAAPES